MGQVRGRKENGRNNVIIFKINKNYKNNEKSIAFVIYLIMRGNSQLW